MSAKNVPVWKWVQALANVKDVGCTEKLDNNLKFSKNAASFSRMKEAEARLKSVIE